MTAKPIAQQPPRSAFRYKPKSQMIRRKRNA